VWAVLVFGVLLGPQSLYSGPEGSMTELEEMRARVIKLEARVARLKKRLLKKKKYEAGYLQATSATPQLRDLIDQKDRAVLED